MHRLMCIVEYSYSYMPVGCSPRGRLDITGWWMMLQPRGTGAQAHGALAPRVLTEHCSGSSTHARVFVRSGLLRTSMIVGRQLIANITTTQNIRRAGCMYSNSWRVWVPHPHVPHCGT